MEKAGTHAVHAVIQESGCMANLTDETSQTTTHCLMMGTDTVASLSTVSVLATGSTTPGLETSTLGLGSMTSSVAWECAARETVDGLFSPHPKHTAP